MPRINWVIEEFERDNSFHLLAEEVKRQGHVCHYVHPYKDPLAFMPLIDDVVIFQGTIEVAKQIQKKRPAWAPGVWATWENFECTTYFAHYGKYLFNQDYMILPFAEAQRKMESFLISTSMNAIFIRPNGADKLFPGSVIFDHDLTHGSERAFNTWRFIGQQLKPTDLVVLAPTHLIGKEWRVLCSKGRVITGSRYKTHGQPDYKRELPKGVSDLALEIASLKFQPDPMYVLDICEDSDRNLRLLEIGPVSVAGLYHCELDKFVEAACELAALELQPINTKEIEPCFASVADRTE